MSELIVVSAGRTQLTAFGKLLMVSCLQADRIKEKLPVIYSLNADGSQGYPYMPKPFPIGTWNVIGAREEKDPELAPWVLQTDAHQLVERWEVSDVCPVCHGTRSVDGDDGKLEDCPTCKGTGHVALHYVSPIGDFVEDWGYEFHFDAIWKTTDGCIRMSSSDDATWLCQQYLAVKAAGEAVQISVV